MPQALAVDWNEVKTLAFAVGLREAARQLNVPEDAARQRSCREGWFSARAIEDQKQLAAVATLRERQGMSPIVTKAADALENYGKPTRLNHAKASLKLSGKLASLDEDELLNRVPDLLGAGKHAALVHGWDQSQTVNTLMVLDSRLLHALAPPVIEVEAEVEQS